MNYDACDDRQLGALLVGRRFEATLTLGRVRAIQAAVGEWAKKTALPLVFLNPGQFDGAEDETTSETYYAGLLVAVGEDGTEPSEVDRAGLSPERLASIPDDFWQALETDFELTAVDSEDFGPATGVFLAPAGWAVATLILGEERIATTASENDPPGLRLTDELLSQLRTSGDAVRLEGAYC